jgi:hypothetical protein
MTSARLDPSVQTEIFINKGFVAWTYTLIDARILRVIRIDESVAKKEVGDDADVDTILAAVAESATEMPLKRIERVRRTGIPGLLAITHAGEELDVYTDDGEQTERMFEVLAERTKLERGEVEGTFLDAALTGVWTAKRLMNRPRFAALG